MNTVARIYTMTMSPRLLVKENSGHCLFDGYLVGQKPPGALSYSKLYIGKVTYRETPGEDIQ